MKISLRKLSYALYVGCKKLLQFPRVMSDFSPKFIADEVVRPASGDVYAVVVNYSKFGVPGDLLDLLRTLRAANVNPVVVCNGRPKDGAYEALKSEAHRVLIRRNIGRDFGAYRAISLHLHRSGLKASRVLYFNDSVIYLAGEGLRSMIAKLVSSPYPVTGTFENHEIEHHVGSYAFSLSGEAFHNRRMQKFWQRYRPYDIRPHAIHKGEIAMSRRLKKLGYGVDVVYSVDQLATRMQTMEAADILDLVRFMPTNWRGAFLDRARSKPFGLGTRIVGELAEPKSKPTDSRPSVPSLSSLKAQTRAETRAGAESLQFTLQKLSKMALIDCMLAEIEVRSQVHIGFGLYHHLLGAPMIKKDLLQRGVYAEHDFRNVLGGLSGPTRVDVMRQLVNRGRPIGLRGMRRFMIHNGLE